MPDASPAIMPTYGRLPVTFSRGEGAVLYDTNDRAYLDGVSGIAVTNLGHQYPRVTRAVAEQASRLIHTSNRFTLACRKPWQSNCAPRRAWKTCFSATRVQKLTRRP